MTNDDNTSKQRNTLQRNYRAPLETVWELWTTKGGIESWWGPEGFEVEVRLLDLRPGGELRYIMTAKDPAQIEFMRNEGMPLATEVTISFTEVTPQRRLEFTFWVDFVSGVDPYLVSTTVELGATADGVQMTVTFDAMHDNSWTERAKAGHESELTKLDKILGSSL